MKKKVKLSDRIAKDVGATAFTASQTIDMALESAQKRAYQKILRLFNEDENGDWEFIRRQVQKLAGNDDV